MDWASQKWENLRDFSVACIFEECTSENYICEAGRQPHVDETTSSQDLKILVISYQTNQLANLQLWNCYFCLIFLFGIVEYLACDAKNVHMFPSQNGFIH